VPWRPIHRLPWLFIPTKISPSVVTIQTCNSWNEQEIGDQRIELVCERKNRKFESEKYWFMFNLWSLLFLKGKCSLFHFISNRKWGRKKVRDVVMYGHNWITLWWMTLHWN
jgi:hypothetical protein